MADYEIALTRVLKNEGGYGNDPADPGGETYKGVAHNMFPKWDGWDIINSKKKLPNFPASLENDVDLQEKVKEFYLNKFWHPVKGEDIIDQDVAFAIFDFAVNAGVGTSSALVQKVLDIEVDGVIGKNTVQAINAFDKEKFLAFFTLAKIARYISIVKRRPTSKKYFLGWVTRALNH